MENIKQKIKSMPSLVKIIDNLKKKGKKVVQCHGVFDLVHLGHIRHFNLAKKEGDVLVVTVTRDRHVKRGPGRPIFNEEFRMETLASLAVTDFVTMVDSPTAIEAIKTLKPDIYVKGNDYKNREKDVTGMIYDEEEAVKSVGGKIAFTDDITFSSSNLINNYMDAYPPRTMKYLKALGKRYTIDEILNSVQTVKKLKALVIGDTIIDEYHYCTPMGKSSKEHLVANKYISEEMFAGGSLATANNVANICGEVDLITVLGENKSYREFIQSKLNSNITPFFVERPGTDTIIKRRYVSKLTNAKLFEICFIQDHDIPKDIESKIIDQLEKTIKKYDIVIVSDFGHGLLTKKIIKLICSKAKYLAVNVQTNSANIGFNLVTKYPKANCVCIDEMELRFAAHDRFSDIRELCRKVYAQIGCEHLIATRGATGSISFSKEHGFHETPAFAYRVVDAIGAGDAFFAYVGPCFAAKLPQDMVSFIGNAVGSLAVQIICNREPVSVVDLSKFITRLLK